MKSHFLRSISRAMLALLTLVCAVQTVASAQSVNSYDNRIVGVWDVQVTLLNCTTGTPFAAFRGLNKYELGGTAQVVPATNPAALSPHVGVWSHVAANDYKLAFKMFRFDGAGNNIGWQIVRFDVRISDDAALYAGSGKSEVFDVNGNLVGTSCPTLTGARFQ